MSSLNTARRWWYAEIKFDTAAGSAIGGNDSKIFSMLRAYRLHYICYFIMLFAADGLFYNSFRSLQPLTASKTMLFSASASSSDTASKAAKIAKSRL